MGTYDELVLRIRDRRAQLARELVEQRHALAASESSTVQVLAPGARVFDRVTGRMGVVIERRTENFTV